MKLNELVEWYEQLTPDRLAEIDRLYQDEATFRDPFNNVSGRRAIEAIFRHMFETTETPRFEMIDRQTRGDIAWLRWIFKCRLKGRPIAIDGASRLIFGEDGRVAEHRDYWDATDLFLQLPLLGTMIHFLKQRLSVPESTLSGE
ncbi:MAG: nuclear transport factor 2 family protein [Chromatiales bacterium]|jgi:ketosteroid isomerase-like protein